MKANEKTPLFSKAGNWVFLITSILLLNLQQCKCHHEKLTFTKPVKAPVAISFWDANRLLQAQIPSVKVTLIDEGGQVVTPNNLSFSSLEITGGVMVVALKDSARFNNDTPYRFAIRAEAPGYSTASQSIVIREDKAQYVYICMSKIDAPPVGGAGFTGAIPISNSKIGTGITLLPNATNKQNRKISVMFQDQTKLLHNGEPLRGNPTSVTYNFSYNCPGNINALRTFPGGPLVTDAVDSIGNKIATPGNPFQFASAGWITLEMKAGSETVTSFDKPVDLLMPIDDSLINPITSRPYKDGDRIDVWSLNEYCVWKKETSVAVKNSTDGLVATISITHLSDWNLDFKINVCASTQLIYDNNTPMPITSPCELVYMNGTKVNGFFGSHTLTFNTGVNNMDHKILNGPNGSEVVLISYAPGSPGGPILAQTGFTFCSGPLPHLIFPNVAANSVTLDFVIRQGGNEYPICSNVVFFKPNLAPGSYRYGDGLTVLGTRGTATLYQAAPFGATDIQLFYGGKDGMGNTFAQTVMFTANLADMSGSDQNIVPTISGVASPDNVICRWIPATLRFEIVIPGGGNGVGIINTCL
jgi:hypothetical protein